MFMVALPLQILVGIVSAYIAFKKNRNYLAWFFGGMFLGLIGIIVLLILPPLEITSNANRDLLEKRALSELKENPSIFQDKVLIDGETWYYLDENRKNVGPMSFEQLVEQVKKRPNKEETWIWNKGMPGWKRAKELPLLSEKLK